MKSTLLPRLTKPKLVVDPAVASMEWTVFFPGPPLKLVVPAALMKSTLLPRFIKPKLVTDPLVASMEWTVFFPGPPLKLVSPDALRKSTLLPRFIKITGIGTLTSNLTPAPVADPDDDC